jgi:hypothetical protein
MYYLRFTFATRSLTVLDSLRVGPCFALMTLKRMGKMQLGPRGRPTVVRPQIRRGLAGVRPGRAGEGPRVYHSSIGGLGWGRGAAGGGGPRLQAAAAAGALAPVSLRPRKGNGRCGQLLGGLGKVWRSIGRQGVDRTVGLRTAGTAGSRRARGWPVVAYL